MTSIDDLPAKCPDPAEILTRPRVERSNRYYEVEKAKYYRYTRKPQVVLTCALPAHLSKKGVLIAKCTKVFNSSRPDAQYCCTAHRKRAFDIKKGLYRLAGQSEGMKGTK